MTLATAPHRARPLSELTGHMRSVANELAEWGYYYTGRDGQQAAIMTHPRAGVVRIHTSPKSKSGARMTILRIAHVQLHHIGIKVDLPWKPNQPKPKEATMPPTAVDDRVKLDRRGVRDRITDLATKGAFGDEFQASDVYAYMHGRYRLPDYSGDYSRPGSVVVSQVLQELAKQGVLYRRKIEGSGAFMYRSALTEGTPDVALAPEPELVQLTGSTIPVVDTTGEVIATVATGHVGEATPTPVAAPATPGLPAEALEALRGYFVGDLQAENELLREAFTDVVALLKATAESITEAAQDAAEALAAVGERRYSTRRPARAAKVDSKIGPLREARLQKMIESVPHNVAVDYKKMAALSDLTLDQAGNALAVAARIGWRSVDGHTVTVESRGHYVIHDPEAAA